MKVTQYLRNVSIMPQASYYSGSPAKRTDLDGQKLFSIYSDLTKECGEKAGDNFISLVRGMETLALTPFINSLFALETNGWIYTKKGVSNKKIYVDSIGTAKATVFNALTGGTSTVDETKIIKSEFESLLKERK